MEFDYTTIGLAFVIAGTGYVFLYVLWKNQEKIWGKFVDLLQNTGKLINWIYIGMLLVFVLLLIYGLVQRFI
jgi:hypothetical protein